MSNISDLLYCSLLKHFITKKKTDPNITNTSHKNVSKLLLRESSFSKYFKPKFIRRSLLLSTKILIPPISNLSKEKIKSFEARIKEEKTKEIRTNIYLNFEADGLWFNKEKLKIIPNIV